MCATSVASFFVKITCLVLDFWGMWLWSHFSSQYFCRLADKNLNKVEVVFNVNGRQNLTFERGAKNMFSGLKGSQKKKLIFKGKLKVDLKRWLV